MVGRVRNSLAKAGRRPGAAPDADWIGAVDGSPSRRPSLAYQWALDVSASELHRQRRSPVLIAAHPVLGLEAAHRLGVAWDAPPHTGATDADPTMSDTVGSGLGGMARGDARPAVLWVEPTTSSWHPTLDRVEHLLDGTGYLLVLTSSPWLASGLPEWSASGAPSHRGLLGGWVVVRKLRAARWSVETTLGFRGVRGLGLGALARLAAMARRDVLADRLSVRMRERMVERGVFARLSTVTLVGARPPVGQHGTR